jgi:hypothetical protein
LLKPRDAQPQARGSSHTGIDAGRRSSSCPPPGRTGSTTSGNAVNGGVQLHALAYNLANFLRTLALPHEVEHWSLTTLREKLVKIGARIVRHGRYVVFQLAEVAVTRSLFAEILRRIDRLRPRPLLT